MKSLSAQEKPSSESASDARAVTTTSSTLFPQRIITPFRLSLPALNTGIALSKTKLLNDQKSKDLAKVEQHLKAIEHQLILLEPLASMDASDHSPRRAPVDHLGNVERFESIDARFIRFTVLGTEGNNRHEPCLDELEIFRAGARSINVAHLIAGG